MPTPDLEYAGFWLRVWAAFIDSLLVAAVFGPVLIAVYGPGYFNGTSLVQGPLDFVLSWVLPAIAVVLFWMFRQATPGKMVISAQVVDARTGGKASTGQLIARYFGYYVAMVPLFIGILWVAFDPRKQGWHDKIAGTVVVRKRGGHTKPVSFPPPP